VVQFTYLFNEGATIACQMGWECYIRQTEKDGKRSLLTWFVWK